MNIHNNFRAWIKYFYSVLVLLCLAVAVTNYVVDPMWNFTHSNKLNSHQLPIDERQQKSNYLIANAPEYDALMLGSSRVTFIDQKDITGYTAFNFSVNAMDPSEYADFAGFSKRHNHGKIKLIFLGVDFFGSNGNFKGYGYKIPAQYFQNAENVWYRYKVLFTSDALYYSIKNIRQLFSPTRHSFYDRNNIKNVLPISPEFRAINIAKDLNQFSREHYSKAYEYYDIKPHLLRLREQNPSCRFVVFTTPESKPLWETHLSAGRLEDYLRWLGDLVEVFGEIHDFMGENEITTHTENFQDAHHLTPLAAKKMVTSVLDDSQTRSLDVTNIVTAQNFQTYAEKVRARYNVTKH